jgi:hypothetical protein
MENEWIEHTGDKCPLVAGTPVEVRFRNGGHGSYEALRHTAGWRDASARFWVTSDDHHSDIIAYRVVKP